MAGIANRLKQALNLDTKAGGTPVAAENAAAAPNSASPAGPGTDQSSAGVSTSNTMQTSGAGMMNESGMTGMQTGQTAGSRAGGIASPVGPGTDQSAAGLSNTNSSNMQTGELRDGSAVGAPTGQTGELRTGGVSGSMTSGTTESSRGATMGSIASTGVPHSTDMPLPDRSTLTSSAEHWEQAQVATEEARRQAKLVEEGARSHAEATEEYYHAERDYTRAQHTVEEIETKIRNLGLESKQQRLSEARAAYAAEKERLSTLYGPAQELRSEAEAAQDVVNRKGRELEAEVQESKLYSDRLAALEADLNEARLAEEEARTRHAKHLAELEPLATKHKHHAGERERLAGKLSSLQGFLDVLRRKEAELLRDLEGRRGEHEDIGAELAEAEEIAARKEQEAMGHCSAMERLRQQREELGALLGQKREAVHAMTKDTQDIMARAQQQSDTADAQAAELQRTKQQVAAVESDMGRQREALSAAVAEQRDLQGSARSTANNVETYAQQASALEAELRAAKERVDLAQARKEELWEVAKAEGARGDTKSDTHYIKNVAEPAGIDPTHMVQKSDKTESIAGKIEYGVNKLMHHGQEGTTQNPAQV
jgi:hypothetical protein